MCSLLAQEEKGPFAFHPNTRHFACPVSVAFPARQRAFQFRLLLSVRCRPIIVATGEG
jgi:hypothetical protein